MRIFGGIAKLAVPDRGGGTDEDNTVGTHTDAALLAAHVAGDPHAFTALVARHHDYLWQIARRTSYSPEDAADALQEALISAYRRAATFREHSAVRSWLHSIVVNACLDRIRRNRARPTVPLFENVPEDTREIRDPIEDREATLDLEAALRSLPDDQRAAIVAVDVEGYSVREAARLLGIAEGTVKSRCSRARRRLADVLRPEGNRS